MSTSFGANIEPQCSTIFTASKQQFTWCFSKFCGKPTSYALSKKLPSLSVAHELKSVLLKNRLVSMSSSGNESGGLTYKDAGVDIDAGSELVRRIAKMAPGIGGFGGLYPLGMKLFCAVLPFTLLNVF